MKKILTKSNIHFPFAWVDLDHYPSSNANRVEIYIKEQSDLKENLKILFYDFFENIKDDIYVYNRSWGDFTLDTWNIDTDTYDYSFLNKPAMTANYLQLLQDSNIVYSYSGSCQCHNWDIFLSITLSCIVTHLAPYSPIFYYSKNNFFFYFHHSGSIGLYFKEEDEIMSKIMKLALENYIVE